MSADRSHSAVHSRAAWNTVISSGPTGSAPKPPGASRRQKTVLAVIGGTAAARIVRDRRTYERVILLVIVAAAAAGLARASQDRSIARLIAWDKRQTLAKQRRAGAHRRRGSPRSGLVHTSQVRFSLSPLATLPSVSMVTMSENLSPSVLRIVSCGNDAVLMTSLSSVYLPLGCSSYTSISQSKRASPLARTLMRR